MVPAGAIAPRLSHVIDLIETVYDFQTSDSEWLDAIADVGAPIFDHGLGFAIDEYVVTPRDEGAEVAIRTVRNVSLPLDYETRFRDAVRALPPEMLTRVHPLSYAGTWTEISKGYPLESKRALEKVGYVDELGILARDPNGIGIRIIAPLPDVAELLPKSREQWQMLGAHIASAYRLRCALASAMVSGAAAASGLPRHAEAVVDPQRFQIVEAVDRARGESAAQCLRRGARRIDRARSKHGRQDPEEALRTWRALVCGRWSLIDWFDADERRFLLAMANPPEVRDPRGLTERECQVVEYAVQGDTNKLIAYRLGLSQARVSALLRSAMKKLGVKTRAQLAQKLPPPPLVMAAREEQVAG
ncbi:MAG: LuxR C-terminal-related transcriptional regulator [Polyangiales bacterium]